MSNRRLLFAAASLAALAVSSAAAAQDSAKSSNATPTPAAEQPAVGNAGQADAAAVEEVVVTGTRVARSRLDTVAPVDVVTSQQLQQQATPELAQALANIAPSLDFPRPAITDGTDSIRPATLRGLSPDQTLVLLNGTRRHASALVNVNGSIGRGAAAVDLNAIPTAALERVEVLRDGASAQYGSDAIAGVINLILRKARSGGELTAQYGNYETDVATRRGERHATDGNTYSVSGWQGLPLGRDGFLTLSGEYLYRNPTNRSDYDPRVPGHVVTARYGDPEVEGKTFYANAGLPLADGWSAYGFAGYQNRTGESAANPRLSTNANNVAAIFPDGFLPLIDTDIDDWTVSGGVKGEVAGFSVDASVTYGDNKVRYDTVDTVNASRGAASATSFYSGTMEYDQLTAALDVTKPFTLPYVHFAKPSTLAFGYEYRTEDYSIQAGEPGSYDFGGVVGKGAGAQGFPGFKPSNAVDVNRDSNSVYIDLDNQVTDKLDVDLAARYEDYSDFGSTATGKIAARYDLVSWFALRGAVSSGFRAPSLQQQYFTATSTNFIPINGVSTPVDVGTFPATSATAMALGGKQLSPEQSVNYSAGGVFHLGGIEVTVDAYRIYINDRIVLSENIQGAPTGDPTAVAIYNLINPPGSGSQLGAARFFINGVSTRTDGIDAVAHYRKSTELYGRFDFTLAGNLNHTDVTKIPTTPVLSGLPNPPSLFARVNVLTFEKGTPQQKYVGAVDWAFGDLGVTLRTTWYGGVYVPSTTPALDFRSPGRFIVDTEFRYKLPWHVTAAFGVSNLLDQYPKSTPTNVNTNGPIGFPSYSPFGFNGRYVYGRLTVGW